MRYLRSTLTLFLLLTFHVAGEGQAHTRKSLEPKHPQVFDREFASKSLSRQVRYRIVVPAGYDKTAQRYPVLYLLHGLYGGYDNWETRTDLVLYAEKYQFVIAMPDAGDSWYTNSATVPQDRFEDYIVEDFIPEVERSWRVLRSPHRRAIAGLSMGGYGALKFALRRPGMFYFAGSISGALNAPGDLSAEQPSFEKGLLEVFGPVGSETRLKNDIYAMARESKPIDTLYFYLDCGSADPRLPSNREFAKILSEKKFRYEYHETPGLHSWEFWDKRLPELLEAVAKRIAE